MNSKRTPLCLVKTNKDSETPLCLVLSGLVEIVKIHSKPIAKTKMLIKVIKTNIGSICSKL